MNTHKCQLYCLPEISEGIVRLETKSLRKRLKLVVHRRLNPRQKRFIKTHISRVIDTLSGLFGRNKDVATPATISATSGLKKGDLVRVRTKEEIEATLNRWGELKGCSFMPEMEPYCNTVQRVLKPMMRFLDERDYKVKKIKGVVLLEGGICEGTATFGPCDRSCFFFWREEWLEKIAHSE